MHAVIGRVRIKPDRAEEALSMIDERGVAMLQGMAGATGGYWARSLDGSDIIQHSFWLFDTEEHTPRRRTPSSGSATCLTRQRRSSVSMSVRSSGRLRACCRASFATATYRASTAISITARRCGQRKCPSRRRS